MDQIVADRLKSRDTVFLGHSVKKVAAKALTAVRVAGDPGAAPAAKKHAARGAVRELKLYGLEVDKAEEVAKSCEAQMEDYARLEAQVKEMVTSTAREIEGLTAELQVAKKVRTHKEQYEALAQLVNRHACKPATRAQQAEVHGDVKRLREEKARLDEQTNVRGRQFSLLLAAIGDLTRTLVEDPLDDPRSGADKGGGQEAGNKAAKSAAAGGGAKGAGKEGAGEEGEEDEEEDEEEDDERSGRTAKRSKT
mmetsp:Transcript_32033/g.72167  ORF Transcript_32033/g.72167 Transcript_32033/m.72167 type:complete len:251 (+) Transcript_32033:130-882(+)